MLQPTWHYLLHASRNRSSCLLSATVQAVAYLFYELLHCRNGEAVGIHRKKGIDLCLHSACCRWGGLRPTGYIKHGNAVLVGCLYINMVAGTASPCCGRLSKPPQRQAMQQDTRCISQMAHLAQQCLLFQTPCWHQWAGKRPRFYRRQWWLQIHSG
jgi:hypothetical protein